MESDINTEIDKLTISMIETSDLSNLIKYSRQLKITNVADMCELKQKIILEIMKKKETVINSEFYTDDFKNIKATTLKEDNLRREHLKKYIDHIEEIYNEIMKLEKIPDPAGIEILQKDDPLKSRIVNEFPKFEEQIWNKKDSVTKEPNCALLICGDSGAGKSSFINLLCNDEILPVSIRSNTACQVRLTYAKFDEYADIIDVNKNQCKIEKKDFQKDLANYLQNFGNERKHSCNSATIYLKTPVLEGGLDIYDTIGLRESKLFDDDLMKDLKDITGILFLLKKNNPIGDETVGGLSKVINQIARNGIPGSSMHFIINMCDQLDKATDKAELKENVKKQIRQHCMGLNPEITTFSTKQELFLQKNHYMSKDYQNIMTLIQNLHINSINTNTVSIFEMVFQFILKSINFIAESETFTEDDIRSKNDHIKKLRNLLEDKEKLNAGFRAQNKRFLKEKYEKLKHLIISHFNDVEVKKKIFRQVLNNQSTLFGKTDQDKIDDEIMELTHNSILESFKEYVEKEKLLANCCEEMLQNFLQQYAEHQKKKDQINEEVAIHINAVMDDMGNLKMRNFNDLLGLPGEQRKMFTLFAPIVIPIIEVQAVLKRGLLTWFTWISSIINKSNVQKFYEDTTGYVTNKSLKYYTNFFNKKRNIKMIMDSLFFAPNKVTENFEKYLADDMSYLTKNINILDEDMRNKDNVIRTYKNIKGRLTALEEELCKFYLLYLQKDKYDVFYENIESNLKQNDANKPVLENLNRFVYDGHFKGTQETDSAILAYKTSNNKTFKQLYLEFLKQKKILNVNRAKTELQTLKCFMEIRFHILLSLEEKVNLYPMFIVNGIDYSLKKYIDENRSKLKKSDKDLYDEIRRLLKQILDGLVYLHKQKPPLNHYDLTLDSIGYSNMYRAIKLTSISLNTKVEVDYSKSDQNYLEKMSHLPLEILENKSDALYTYKTDVYCLGTIIYYLWVGIFPLLDSIFNKQLITLGQLVKFMKAENMPRRSDDSFFNIGFGKIIFDDCIKCWNNKFTAKEMFEELFERNNLN